MTENPATERCRCGSVHCARPERLFSLDLLRGLDVFWLVIAQPLLEAANKTWTLPACLQAQLVHTWGVFGLFDFAQPLFIFICGAAVPFAIPKRLTPDGRPTCVFWKHVLARVALLWTCGMLIRGVLLFDRTKFTPYSDTLQTIAAGYFFACLAMLIRSRRVRIALPFVLIAVYSALCVLFGDWTRLGNFPRIVDERVFGFFGFKAKDFTYCLTTIAWAGIAMLGSLVAEFLKGGFAKSKKAAVLFGSAVAALALGYALEGVVPPIRHIYSPSFMAITMGYSLLSLALCYVLSDVFMVRRRMGLILLFGQNALCAWMLHSFFWHGVAGVADRIIPGLPVLLGTNRYQGFARIVVVSILIIWLLHLWRRLRSNASGCGRAMS